MLINNSNGCKLACQACLDASAAYTHTCVAARRVVTCCALLADVTILDTLPCYAGRWDGLIPCKHSCLMWPSRCLQCALWLLLHSVLSVMVFACPATVSGRCWRVATQHYARVWDHALVWQTRRLCNGAAEHCCCILSACIAEAVLRKAVLSRLKALLPVAFQLHSSCTGLCHITSYN